MIFMVDKDGLGGEINYNVTLLYFILLRSLFNIFISVFIISP